MNTAAEPSPIPNVADAWFALAHDTHAALASAVQAASTPPPGLAVWSPQAVAVRLLMRTCGNLEAVVVLTRQGLVAEGRTLARSLVENSFAAAALVKDPAEYVDLLKADSERSRRNQATFILQHLPNAGGDRGRLQQAIDAMDKAAELISPKRLALKGPLADQYLFYQRLSDDAAHATARALERHVTRTGGGWRYRHEPGTPAENAATLHCAVLAALGIGIAVTQVLGAAACNARLAELSELFAQMPAITPI
ncbi:DUF5677 domain-containing protein [Ralstonia mojiangensis]|uniref:DUF5677 domain-containing protein n=1 Tax=Ralstonia mojiangensis TaxID=2953895 RepID=UPI0021B1595B|nr:DUF5677 domain-containing protein [Ralstonia mojiangensis]MCT7328017.1 DUF5677 domain-containing protein [Ralstonia mojiangensis]